MKLTDDAKKINLLTGQKLSRKERRTGKINLKNVEKYGKLNPNKRGWFQKHHQRSSKEVDKKPQKKKLLPNFERNKKGSFGIDLSDVSKKNVKNVRDDIGLKR